MKYNLTTLNTFSVILLTATILFIIFFSQDYQIPLAIEIIIIALGGLLLDLALQFLINKISPGNKKVIVNVLGGIIIFVAYFIHRNHARDLKILMPDQIDTIAIVYGVPGAPELPVNYLTLNSATILPSSGILFTSSEMRNSDIPHTRFIKSDNTEIFIEDPWNNRYSDKIEINCRGAKVAVRIIHLGEGNGLEKIDEKHSEVKKRLQKFCD